MGSRWAGCLGAVATVGVLAVSAGCATPYFGRQAPVSVPRGPTSADHVEREPGEYFLEEGDAIKIGVFGEAMLGSESSVVRQDGRITLPLIGDVRVRGLTLQEVDEEVTKRLVLRARQTIEELQEYRMQINDVLGISVWRVPDLDGEFLVRPDGKISFPLVGDVQARGQTLTELDVVLTQGLAQYVVDPQVSVVLRKFEGQQKLYVDEHPDVAVELVKFGGNRVVVMGEVVTPGIYRVGGRNRRILELLALAGGFTDNAIPENVLVIRGPLQQPEVVSVNLGKAIRQGDLSQNILTRANDIVYVPKDVIADITQYYGTLLDPLSKTIFTLGQFDVKELGGPQID